MFSLSSSIEVDSIDLSKSVDIQRTLSEQADPLSATLRLDESGWEFRNSGLGRLTRSTNTSVLTPPTSSIVPTQVHKKRAAFGSLGSGQAGSNARHGSASPVDEATTDSKSTTSSDQSPSSFTEQLPLSRTTGDCCPMTSMCDEFRDALQLLDDDTPHITSSPAPPPSVAWKTLTPAQQDHVRVAAASLAGVDREVRVATLARVFTRITRGEVGPWTDGGERGAERQRQAEQETARVAQQLADVDEANSTVAASDSSWRNGWVEMVRGSADAYGHTGTGQEDDVYERSDSESSGSAGSSPPHLGTSLEDSATHESLTDSGSSSSQEHKRKFSRTAVTPDADGVIRSFLCGICARGFATKCALALHDRSEHQGKRVCCTEPGCDSTFYDATERKRHIASVHRGLKHACSAEGCSSVFARKSDLQRHFASKHMAASFICSDCQKSFTLKTNLVRHRRQIHGKRGSKAGSSRNDD